MKGHVSKDHVHLLVLMPPQVTISRLLHTVEGEDGIQDVAASVAPLSDSSSGTLSPVVALGLRLQERQCDERGRG